MKTKARKDCADTQVFWIQGMNHKMASLGICRAKSMKISVPVRGGITINN